MSYFTRAPLLATARTVSRSKTFRYGCRGIAVLAVQTHKLPDLPYAYNVSVVENLNTVTRSRFRVLFVKKQTLIKKLNGSIENRGNNEI